MAKLKILKCIIKIFRACVLSSGILFLILIFLSFTSLPFWGYYWLGNSKAKISGKPDYIIMLGGGGMPSQSNLMRAFYVFKAAAESPESKIIIAIPGDTIDSGSTPRRVAEELIRKGINSRQILFENLGTNTRAQALHLQNFNSEKLADKPILLVTSPEHMRRAVLVFEKAGFKNLNALPAFENALEADLIFRDDELGGNKILIPDIGDNISVRYQFWNHLKYEILIARELTALAYYKLRGWI